MVGLKESSSGEKQTEEEKQEDQNEAG